MNSSSTGSPASLRQVALAAKVSLGTASRVLAGAGNVDPALRARTLAAAERLGYATLPRRAAAGPGTIGVVLSGMGQSWAGHPLHGTYLDGIQRAAGRSGHGVQVEFSVAGVAEPPRCVAQAQVAGLLLREHRLRPAALAPIAARIPVVVFGSADAPAGVDVVDIDNAGAMAEAVAWLAGLGHRRIAFVNSLVGHPFAGARIDGWRRALQERGCWDPALLVSEEGPIADSRSPQREPPCMDGVLARLRRLEPRPSVALVANDWGALGLFASCRRAGLRPGEDLGIMGIDDVGAYATACDPALSNVALPFAEVGELAMATLAALLAAPAGSRPPPARHLLSGRVMPRASVRPWTAG